MLTVLGGLRSDETPGITTLLFPPFNPPEPPAGATTLDSNTRTALRKTVTATKSYVYSIEGVPQDFLLLPRESPHFSGTWDPIGILLLSDNSRDTRALEGYQFPPPSFISALTDEQDKHPPQHPLDGEEAIECEIASTLEFMKSNDDPKPLRLPPSLWSGPGGVLSGHLMSLDRDAYEVLTLGNDERQADNTISLRGGSAWVEDHDGEMKLMKVGRIYSMRVWYTYQQLIIIVSTSPCPYNSPQRSHSSFPRSQCPGTHQLGHGASPRHIP